jgi:hypothetical protein
MAKVRIKCISPVAVTIGNVGLCTPGTFLVLDEQALPRNFKQLVKDGKIKVLPYHDPSSPASPVAEEPKVEESQSKDDGGPQVDEPAAAPEPEEEAPATEPEPEPEKEASESGEDA